MDHVTLVGVHRFQSHAALVLDCFLCHLFRKLGEGFLPLGTVVLGIDAHTQMLLGAVVDRIVGEVLDGVQRFASAPDHGAHAGTGEVDHDSAAFPFSHVDLRLDTHMLQQSAQEAAHGGIVRRFIGRRRGGSRCSLLLRRFGFHRGLLFRLLFFDRCRCRRGGSFILRLPAHAHLRRLSADPEEPGLRTLDQLHRDIIAVQAQFAERCGDGVVLGLAGFFQIVDHAFSPFSFAAGSTAAPSAPAASRASSAVFAASFATLSAVIVTSSATVSSMDAASSDSSAAASVAASAASGFENRSGT